MNKVSGITYYNNFQERIILLFAALVCAGFFLTVKFQVANAQCDGPDCTPSPGSCETWTKEESVIVGYEEEVTTETTGGSYGSYTAGGDLIQGDDNEPQVDYWQAPPDGTPSIYWDCGQSHQPVNPQEGSMCGPSSGECAGSNDGSFGQINGMDIFVPDASQWAGPYDISGGGGGGGGLGYANQPANAVFGEVPNFNAGSTDTISSIISGQAASTLNGEVVNSTILLSGDNALGFGGGVALGREMVYQNGQWEYQLNSCSWETCTCEEENEEGECLDSKCVWNTCYKYIPAGTSPEACTRNKGRWSSRTGRRFGYAGGIWYDTQEHRVRYPIWGLQIISGISCTPTSCTCDGCDGSMAGGTTINLTSHFGTKLSISVPCATAERTPYPRALTGEINGFEVYGATSEASSPSLAVATSDIKNYQLHARLVPRAEPVPLWDWEEREWGGEENGFFARGWVVEHIYDTSSFITGDISDIEVNGPSLDGEYLSAYQVQVFIAYKLEVSQSWTDWLGGQQSTPWMEIKLSEDPWSYPTDYVLGMAKDVTAPPSGVPVMRDYPCNIPVPVIESQAVISDY